MREPATWLVLFATTFANDVVAPSPTLSAIKPALSRASFNPPSSAPSVSSASSENQTNPSLGVARTSRNPRRHLTNIAKAVSERIANRGISRGDAGDQYKIVMSDCSSGLVDGVSCCASSCGVCGGSGCDNRMGGARACCGGIIAKSNRKCDKVPPPCVLASSFFFTPATTTGKIAENSFFCKLDSCVSDKEMLSTAPLVCPQRVDIPDSAAMLLRAGDFGAALDLATKHGFVNIFAHMRKLSKTESGMLHPTLDYFDWVAQDQEQVVYEAKRPHGFFWTKGGPGTPFRTVLSTAGKLSLTNVLNAIKDAPPATNRVLVVCGSDNRLSGAPQPYWAGKIRLGPEEPQGELMKKIVATGVFSTIRYEAMDVPLDGVQVTPQPLSHRYTDNVGGDEYILTALNSDAAKLENKPPHSILAAWGSVWKDLDKVIKSRRDLIRWVHKGTSLVSRSHLTPREYWAVLVTKRFVLCPTGGAIQSPKVAEAILARTIPITYQETAYQKLAALGYPIVNVNSWMEITVAKLDQWWEELSPILDAARWMLLQPIWGAFVTSACPTGSIHSFMSAIKAQPLLSEMHAWSSLPDEINRNDVTCNDGPASWARRMLCVFQKWGWSGHKEQLRGSAAQQPPPTPSCSDFRKRKPCTRSLLGCTYTKKDGCFATSSPTLLQAPN